METSIISRAGADASPGRKKLTEQRMCLIKTVFCFPKKKARKIHIKMRQKRKSHSLLPHFL